ncbi:MAG: ADP-ribosylglycohydrolase family protein [Oscillospiraceae bacterium]
MDLKEKILSGMMGLAIGDALGVPVEFSSREDLQKNPVTDMLEYGTHNQPKGTWSDDSSMAFCTVVSLAEKGLDIKDIRKRFEDWYYNDYMTPNNQLFDCGYTVSNAIRNHKGCDDVYSNGNGSLMRILPIAYYLYVHKELNLYDVVKEVSSITHAHDRSVLGCAIYVSIAISLIEEKPLKESIINALDTFKDYPEFYHYQDLYNLDNLQENDITSSGYVVATLKASLWCLLKTLNYKDCVLKAVNLGDDTDTVGAVCGGLAGLIYGYDDIPNSWLQSLQRRRFLESICVDYATHLE